MKVGYSDTINNKAYQDKTSASPFKMVDKSKADLDKDGKVSEYESKRADAAFGETPLNMKTPIYAKSKYTGFGRGEKYLNPPTGKTSSKLSSSFSNADEVIKKEDKTPEETTEPGRVSTKTTRIVKSGGGTGGSTVGREVVKGIKKLVDKRKKKRAADPNVQAKKEGRKNRKKIKVDSKLFDKTEKAKDTKIKQDEKTAKKQKKLDRKIEGNKHLLKNNPGLKGSYESLIKEGEKKQREHNKKRKNKKN